MIAVSNIEMYNILKGKLGDSQAKALTEYIEAKVEERVTQKKEIFLTKEDKVDIMRTIYVVGLIQFLAIVGSVLAIVNFMLK